MQTATTQVTPLVNPSRAARRAEKQAQYVARQARIAALKQAPKRQESRKPVAKSSCVMLKDGANFVIILNLWHKDIPNGLQVTPRCGGGGGDGTQVKREKTDFAKASVDVDGLMGRCYVDSIHISKDHIGFCKVYVNCIVGVAGPYRGFGPFAGQYEQFVRRELVGTIPRVIVRKEEGKTSLEVPRREDEEATSKIQFAIER